MNAGRLVALSIFLLCLFGAGGSLWYQHHTTRHAAALWGTPATLLVARAPQAELLRLSGLDFPDPAAGAAGGQPAAVHKALEPGEPIRFNGGTWNVADRKELNGARGLVHLRHALRQNASYEWDAAPAEPADWQAAIRFGDQQGSATLLVDWHNGQIALADSQAIARITPKFAQGLRIFIAEHLPLPADERRPSEEVPTADEVRTADAAP